MAVLKHIASKNSNYTDALNYLLFQHNDITHKPVLDEKGRMILREEYYMDGINCEPMLFDQECEKLNEQYHKNQTYDEIKSHHYIISFDPKDREDHGLTGEKAQALGLEYARKNFPGHQALVVTHTDGHNSSGNIHVHIIINSLRKQDVERQDFMERPCDSRAGYKHHLTRDYLKYLKKSVMEMCLRENLYQVNLLSPAKRKITNKEYWASRRGQTALEKKNEQIVQAGLTPRTTIFQTQKQYIRDAVSDIAATAKSLEEFQRLLRDRYQIDLTDKRGRFSYLHPDRSKHISERALGTQYTRETILMMLDENSRGTDKSLSSEQEKAPISGQISDAPVSPSDLPPIIFIRSNLRLVIDLQKCVKAGQNKAYERKVKISNLQEMAKTIAYVQENGYDTQDDLQTKYEEVKKGLASARHDLKETETKIRAINEQIHFTGQYLAKKSIYAQFLHSHSKKKFRSEHFTDLEQYETASKYLKTKHPDGKIPSLKTLQSEKEKLLLQKTARNETYNYFKDYQKELSTVCSNVDAILQMNREPAREQGKTKDIS